MINLNQIDDTTIAVLAQLRVLNDGAFRKFLTRELSTAQDKLLHANDTVTIHRLQGSALAFAGLIKALDDLPKVMQRS